MPGGVHCQRQCLFPDALLSRLVPTNLHFVKPLGVVRVWPARWGASVWVCMRGEADPFIWAKKECILQGIIKSSRRKMVQFAGAPLRCLFYDVRS